MQIVSNTIQMIGLRFRKQLDTSAWLRLHRSPVLLLAEHYSTIFCRNSRITG